MPPKMRRKGMEPSVDLPSLFPTHDGSYGINTLINLDSEAKKGHKANSDIAKEQSDDKTWVKSMKSQVAKKYGMNSNLKKAIIESHEQVEKEHQDQPFISPREPLVSKENNSRPYGYSTSTDFAGTLNTLGSTNVFQTNLAPHVPHYNPNHLPFPEESHDRSHRPRTRAEIPSHYPYAPAGVSQIASPPSDHIPFYGMPNGKGSMQPISLTRQDSPNNFDEEEELFANAVLQTPTQPKDTSARTAGLDFAMDPPSWRPESKVLFGPGSEHMILPTPGMEPNVEEQPASGHNATVQPVDEQPAMEEPVLGQPTIEQLPSMGQPTDLGQPAVKQPTIEQLPSMGQPTDLGQPAVKQPTMGQPPKMGQPAMVQPAMAQPAMAQPTMAQPAMGHTPKMGQSTVGQSSMRQLNPVLTSTSGQARSFDLRRLLEPPNIARESISKKTNETGASKQASTSGTKQLNKKPPVGSVGKPNASPQNSPANRRGKDRQVGWVWPSSDLIITSAIMFSALVFVVWAALSALPGAFNTISRASSSLSDLNFGAIWEKVANQLPDFPDEDNIPHEVLRGKMRAPRRSDYSNLDYENILTNLKDSIPDAVWVKSDETGKVKLPEDFWHALKGISKGNNIPNLGNSGISDDVLDDIMSRLRTDDYVDKKISQAWESWLKENDRALKKASTGSTLTKDEFMKLFEEEAASYEREIKEELSVLQGSISSLTQQISRLQKETSAGGTLSKRDIKNVVETVVSKAITNAGLDAIAQGRIKGHANDVLANEMNFFSIDNGAIIDPSLSSLSRRIPKPPIGSRKFYDTDGYQAMPPAVAISPWSREGECFCAGPDRKGYGQGTNNISVSISRRIIPQHLVVEHILPGATLDPGAMPKDIEVWAYIEEVNLRNELRAFSETRFPGTPKEQVLNEGYVKIGHFTYEQKKYGDGVQVFKISDELARMKASTNHLIVRALNNYGADHTCFYQLKMYGNVVEHDQPARRISLF